MLVCPKETYETELVMSAWILCVDANDVARVALFHIPTSQRRRRATETDERGTSRLQRCRRADIIIRGRRKRRREEKKSVVSRANKQSGERERSRYTRGVATERTKKREREE